MTIDAKNINGNGIIINNELIELTGYKKSSISDYIKTSNPMKKGRFKGYKILKLK